MINLTDQPQNPPFDAFNNSVLKFTSDSGTPKAANITISGSVFDIFPDADGAFYFNLTTVAQVLINQNHFADQVVPDPGEVVILDPTLFLDMEVKIDVELTDGTVETLTKSFPFLKSVKQLLRRRYNNEEMKVLLPGATDVAFATYFEGYPFDVSLYSNTGRTVTVTNKRTGVSSSILLTRGVNRVFISNGEDGSALEGLVPLHLGTNELEFKSGSLYFTLFLKKYGGDCGHYLKYFNQAGGWSYWRFNSLYIEQRKADTLDRLNNDFENLYNDAGNFDIIGRQTERSKEFLSGLLDQNEKETVLEMFSSPKVYLYAGDLSDRFADRIDFITVEAASGTYSTGNKFRFEELKAKINLPKEYGQRL